MRAKTKLTIAALAFLVMAVGLFQPASATCLVANPLVQSVSGATVSSVWTQGYFAGGNLGVPFNPATGVSYYPAFLFPFAAGSRTNPTAGYGAQFVQPAVSANYQGFWWVQGFGDPDPGNVASRGNTGAVAANTDSGAFSMPVSQPAPGGALGWTLNYAGYVATGWAASPQIDGCPNEGAQVPGGSCVCVLMTDQWNGDAYFAVSGVGLAATGFTNFAQPGRTTPGIVYSSANARDPIILRPIPQPRITGSSVVSDTQVDVEVTQLALAAGPAGGDYTLAGCDCAPTSFVVHQRNAGNVNPGSGSAEPDPNPDRSIGSGWSAVSPATPIGDPAVVNATCSGDQSIFLASQLCFPNGGAGEFCTPVVSASAVEVECGPNLAEPGPGPGRGKGKGKGRVNNPNLVTDPQ